VSDQCWTEIVDDLRTQLHQKEAELEVWRKGGAVAINNLTKDARLLVESLQQQLDAAHQREAGLRERMERVSKIAHDYNFEYLKNHGGFHVTVKTIEDMLSEALSVPASPGDRIAYDPCNDECPIRVEYSKLKANADRLPTVERALRLAIKQIGLGCPTKCPDWSARPCYKGKRCDDWLYDYYLKKAAEKS
jgi:hypothetical protein